mmetsp:Transcript_4117/g.6993  ORF Transcript_4117/g.6993 Transcript_4117/m.6993 type:complete len:274 (-) Transcript_4117:35-856(-)
MGGTCCIPFASTESFKAKKQPLLPDQEIESAPTPAGQPRPDRDVNPVVDDSQTADSKTGPEERLKEFLASLPSKGIIKFEEDTNFWSINLGEAWNGEAISSQIVSLCKPLLEGHGQHEACHNKAMLWASTLNDKDAVIECVKPPSVAGFHISLARWSKSDAQFPKDKLVEGKTVEFECGDIELFVSDRAEPVNLPGQHMDEDGFRYYPILWIKTPLTWKDFEFQTRFAPHISLAALAVRLKVDEVEQYQQDKGVKDTVADSVVGADALDKKQN